MSIVIHRCHRLRPEYLALACLVAFLVICTGSETRVWAQSGNSPEEVIASHMGRATVIVVPQSGCVIVPSCPHPPYPPYPYPPRPRPPQEPAKAQITHVGASINILEQTATTTLDISLRNPSPQQIEAVLLLPVPDGAAVSAFDFQGCASEPTARVLSRDEARQLYEAIVRQVRDPALLEFAGYNLVRSSVFPIPAGGTQKVRLTYEHLLPAENNRIDYVLPRSESLARRSPWSIAVNIKSQHPISTIYSPSHAIITQRISPSHVKVSLLDSASTSGRGMNPGPLLLSTLVERDGVSASLFAYPDPKVGAFDAHAPGGAGYFLFMAGLPASIDDAAKSVKREVTIVIDRSGSMAGAKMDQARAAALQVVEGLADGEAFNIIDYSTTVQSFAAAPVIKTRETMLEARRYIEAIKSAGGTNIHDALLEALRAPPTDGMLPIVLFLTDGLPTVGQTSEIAIRELVEKGNPHHRRIFTFGVGNDVNVPLLDRVADITRANATYVLPSEDVELKVAAVFKRLYGPVLADLQLRTIDASGAVQTRLVGEMIPSTLPDLFEGDQLILLGQYHTNSPVTFKLTGNFLGQPREFTYQFDFNAATTKNAFVPRLWAARRIAYLVDQIRQMGAAVPGPGMPINSNMHVMNDPRVKELIDEILRLSTEFGILTEYTSFLATEGTNLDNWRDLSAACSDTIERRAVQSRAGAAAINQGMNFNAQKSQQQLNYGNEYIDEGQREVNFTSVQQMNDRAFFQRGKQWIDGRIAGGPTAPGGTAPGMTAPGSTTPGRGAGSREAFNFTPDAIIEYGSPEHLALIDRLVAQNRQGVLALEGDILLVDDGRTILVRNSSE